MNTHFDELPSKTQEKASSQQQQIVEEMLVSFIHENDAKILGVAKLYVSKFSLAKDLANINTIAEDIVQETFVILLKKSDEELINLNNLSWVKKIILNVVRNYYRKNKPITIISNISDFQRNKVSQGKELSEEELLDKLTTQIKKETPIDSKILIQEVLSLLDKESEKIIRLHLCDELEGKELAAHLGINEGTARVRLFRAKKELKVILEKYNKS